MENQKVMDQEKVVTAEGTVTEVAKKEGFFSKLGKAVKSVTNKPIVKEACAIGKTVGVAMAAGAAAAFTLAKTCHIELKLSTANIETEQVESEEEPAEEDAE